VRPERFELPIHCSGDHRRAKNQRLRRNVTNCDGALQLNSPYSLSAMSNPSFPMPEGKLLAIPLTRSQVLSPSAIKFASLSTLLRSRSRKEAYSLTSMSRIRGSLIRTPSSSAASDSFSPSE
jgi:hypothetical protein